MSTPPKHADNMLFTGEIIRESLVDPSVLEEFKAYLVKTRTATV